MSAMIRVPRAAITNERLRAALVFLAVIAGSIAFLQSLTLFAPDVRIGNGRLVGRITTTTHLVSAPILAAVSLFLLAKNRLSSAIVALAVIVLTTWASDLLSTHFDGVWMILLHVFRPIGAILAIFLAIRGDPLRIPATLVGCMWLLWAWHSFLSEVLQFTVGVMIYGA